MIDTSKERCETIIKRLQARTVMVSDPLWKKDCREAADLITALCERVVEVEAEARTLRNVSVTADELREAALAEALRETDAIIEPFARFVNPSPQGAWDGPTIAMGDFQRADQYRRKRFEQTKYKGGTDE